MLFYQGKSSLVELIHSLYHFLPFGGLIKNKIGVIFHLLLVILQNHSLQIILVLEPDCWLLSSLARIANPFQCSMCCRADYDLIWLEIDFSVKNSLIKINSNQYDNWLLLSEETHLRFNLFAFIYNLYHLIFKNKIDQIIDDLI